MAVPFVKDLDPRYGQVVEVTPLVRRVVANNPGKFTFLGTGTYIVGRASVAIIDAGPDDDDHVAAVLAAVADQDVTHLLVTHTHRDHSPATRAVQEATGAPSYGFGPHPDGDRRPPSTSGDAEDLEEPGDMAFRPDVVVAHGDTIEGDGWTLEALHTPGHISNHLCFALAEESGVFTGDHVMGWSTTVIPPPDGNMADYLRSLRLMIDRPGDRTYWPTHGPQVDQPQRFARALLDHRHEREAQVIWVLGSGPATIPELVATMYADIPDKLHEAAGRSVEAHLIHLERAGRVRGVGETGAQRYHLA